jgi:hypothetical protein
VAREQGYEPLAEAIFSQKWQIAALKDRFAGSLKIAMLEDMDAALQGARDIIAEWISQDEKARNGMRREFNYSAMITTRVVKDKAQEQQKQEKQKQQQQQEQQQKQQVQKQSTPKPVVNSTDIPITKMGTWCLVVKDGKPYYEANDGKSLSKENYILSNVKYEHPDGVNHLCLQLQLQHLSLKTVITLTSSSNSTTRCRRQKTLQDSSALTQRLSKCILLHLQMTWGMMPESLLQ